MSASLYHSFLGRRILWPINELIKRSGYKLAFSQVLKNTNSKIITKGLTPELKKILSSKRVLLISNHPGQAEVLAILATLPQRSDYHLIASHSFFSILPAIDHHLIPVYIAHHYENEHFSWKLKLLNRFHSQPNMDPIIAHQKNIQSVALASSKLSQGALVQIFPLIDDVSQNFSPGVGYLLKNSCSVSKTKVVMIHVTGSSDLDYLRLIPFIGRLLPPYSLTFSSAFPASDFIAKTGKETAKNLEISYRAWSSSISSRFAKAPFSFRAANRSYLYLRSLLLWLFTTH